VCADSSGLARIFAWSGGYLLRRGAPVRFYDQVKAYSPGHRVPANDVRALFGVLNLHQNVSKAVITTTALFAPGVYEEFEAVMPNRLELRDGPRLREWLMGLGGPPRP
jgi:hypothetical protein